MGEEENELEGSVYGGDNFVNNVSAIKVLARLTFSSFKLSLVHPNLAGLPHTASLFSPSNQLGQGPRG